ncbi:hypothetical protein IRJ41_013381 [Triplophysa rosa]|uniref:Uncharacterized protein n=1 Tax=Triplophysa rosa TaxID=992332 RepID=A0A9W7WHK6_TRIRA|nr:hypothetical protein IRJ41_013381 [Triplophysa rosa]
MLLNRWVAPNTPQTVGRNLLRNAPVWIVNNCTDATRRLAIETDFRSVFISHTRIWGRFFFSSGNRYGKVDFCADADCCNINIETRIMKKPEMKETRKRWKR